MTARSRSKFSRARANKTHGWGHKKKNRGAGNRGGRGRAGSGKRAASKKPSLWKTERLGRYFFKSLSRRPQIINIKQLEKKFDKENKISVDLEEMGYDKLLGGGKVTKELNIKVPYYTKKAEKKITEAGGKITSESENKQE